MRRPLFFAALCTVSLFGIMGCNSTPTSSDGDDHGNPTTAPSAPALSTPANNAGGIATSTTLSWAATSGADNYTVQVAAVSSFSTTISSQSGVTGTSAQVGGLSSATSYYWRVLASNTAGAGPWSSAWTFSTAGGGNPATVDSSAGTLTAHAGSNSTVDSANAPAVCQMVQSVGMAAVSKALSSATLSKRAVSATNGTLNGTVAGSRGGSATVTGTFTVDEVTGASHYDITCTFNDYADNTMLYLAGQMHFVVTDTLDQGEASSHLSGYVITGALRFNGNYEGSTTFRFDYSVISESSIKWDYTSVIFSHGKTTQYDMHYSR